MFKNSMLDLDVMGKEKRSTLDTAFLREQLLKLLDEVPLSIEELANNAGISKTVLYDNILRLKAKRTSIAVARKIAEGVGYDFKKVGDKFYFKRKEFEEKELAENVKKMVKMINDLDEDNQQIIFDLLVKLSKR